MSTSARIRSEQGYEAIIELPTPVDSTFHQFMFGFVLEVVSEVDEMCLFHQLGYEQNRHGRAESTVALPAGLQETPVYGAHVECGSFLQCQQVDFLPYLSGS